MGLYPAGEGAGYAGDSLGRRRWHQGGGGGGSGTGDHGGWLTGVDPQVELAVFRMAADTLGSSSAPVRRQPAQLVAQASTPAASSTPG